MRSNTFLFGFFRIYEYKFKANQKVDPMSTMMFYVTNPTLLVFFIIHLGRAAGPTESNESFSESSALQQLENMNLALCILCAAKNLFSNGPV